MVILAFIVGLEGSSKVVYLFDFEDSFTFNIANEIWTHFKKEVEVLRFAELLNFEPADQDQIILGPGPGHPDEYHKIFPKVKSILNNSSVRVCGICLGHQIIWSILGGDVLHSKRPLHGQAVSLELNSYWQKFFRTKKDSLFVQRYNSLVVDVSSLDQKVISEWNCLYSEDELMASAQGNCVSFQFHPESIGTEDSQNILSCLFS